ncbi:metallophosphoesterase family protein [Bacillus suaedae]|uniref:Phosphoesterase n=1 Tax=Halalkalibacter suaedae TaxID=2822140 RepID=A0A941AMX0_9BACI|nr:metallophosphoesterase [Bacillus suaedae]
MKALIISDSHGWQRELKEIVDRYRTEVDIIIHCGDSELDRDNEALTGVKVVKGNCDFGDDFEEEIIETVEATSIYVTHGHLYNVKMTTVPLTYRAEEKQADIACFGHSHIATTFEQNGIIYINPGSIKLPMGKRIRTYCICERTDDKTTVTFFEKDGVRVEDMIYEFTV